MNSSNHDLASLEKTHPQRLQFSQVTLFDEFEGDINLSFRDGIAEVLRPGKGVVIEGELLDCPEQDPETGWVVLAVDGRTIAAGSSVFRQLMVENSPCHLRLESVWLQDPSGRRWWDWIAFELSPTGCITTVSDDQPGSCIVSEIGEDSWIRRRPNAWVAQSPTKMG